jgi:biotin transport system substrate-specific component
MRSLFLLTPLELLWAAIGVILTIVGTLIQLSIPATIPWIGGYSFSLQIGGMLLTACLGGPTAGLSAQIVYLSLGLTGSQIFRYGGGIEYLLKPEFGYLLGFLPGAWVCGHLAFRKTLFSPTANSTPLKPKPQPLRLHDLSLAGLSGLLVVHLTGMIYLLVKTGWGSELIQRIALYSGYPLPGQVMVTFTVVALAYVFRRLTFY